jgi:hypothetical protein
MDETILLYSMVFVLGLCLGIACQRGDYNHKTEERSSYVCE